MDNIVVEYLKTNLSITSEEKEIAIYALKALAKRGTKSMSACWLNYNNIKLPTSYGILVGSQMTG
jgi:hypothetical protein